MIHLINMHIVLLNILKILLFKSYANKKYTGFLYLLPDKVLL